MFFSSTGKAFPGVAPLICPSFWISCNSVLCEWPLPVQTAPPPPPQHISCLYCVHTLSDRRGVYAKGNVLFFLVLKSGMRLFIDPRLIFLLLFGIKVNTESFLSKLDVTANCHVFFLTSQQAHRLKSLRLIMKALKCFHWTEYVDFESAEADIWWLSSLQSVWLQWRPEDRGKALHKDGWRSYGLVYGQCHLTARYYKLELQSWWHHLSHPKLEFPEHGDESARPEYRSAQDSTVSEQCDREHQAASRD